MIISVPEAISRVKAGHVLNLAPLCGGLPPDIAWPYLKRVGEVVLPEALGGKANGRASRPLTAERRVMVGNKRFRRNNSTLGGKGA
ncbi:hypothetical protein MAHJHV59_50140 [Mycobacterium avium subsp. hominissuis]